MTLRVSNKYHELISARTNDVKLLSLEDRDIWQRNDAMQALEKEFLIPAEKFVFIMPEYNASFPGIVKLMIDNSDIKKCWWYKKAMLVGVSDGRAGNLRGIEHMTSILHYMRVNVLYNKVLLSKIGNEMDEEGNLLHKKTEEAINLQIEEFLKF